MKLEELARQSSTAARVSVAHLDTPEIGGRRNPARAGLLLGAAAVILVIGIGVLLTSNGDDSDDGETVSAAAPEVPRLGLPPMSSRQVIGAFDLSLDGEDVRGYAAGSFAYYGTPGDDPFGEGDLLIGVLPNDGGAAGDAGPTSITLRGVDASVTSGAESGLPGDPTVVQWTEPAAGGDPAADVIVASRSLSVDDLVAIAEGLSIRTGERDAGATLGDTLPDAVAGLEVVAQDSALPFAGVTRGEGPGSIVAYERSDGDQIVDSVVIQSTQGSLAQMTTMVRWWASTVEAVTVDGEPGWLATTDFVDDSDTGAVSQSFTVLWSPEPSIVAALTTQGDGQSGAVALDLAETVIELDDAAWADALAARDAATSPVADLDVVYTTGDSTGDPDAIADYEWALGLQDGQLCFVVAIGDGSSGSCQAATEGQPGQVPSGPAVAAPDPGTAQVVFESTDNGDIRSVVIAAAPDVEIVESAGVDGGTLTRMGDPIDGIRWIVWVGPAGSDPVFDVMVDGRVVQTLTAAVTGAEFENSAPIAVDVATNPAARSLGIADDFAEVALAGDDAISWVIVESGGQECIVTDGDAVLASCLTGDITVLKPIELPDGEVRSYIVVRNTPQCLTVQGVDAVTALSGSSTETGDGRRYDVIGAPGTVEGWRLLARDDAGVDTWVDLPDIEGSVDWPAGLCG